MPLPLYPQDRVLGTYWIGGWVGPRANPGTIKKRKIPYAYQELNPNSVAVQPIAWSLCQLESHQQCQNQLDFWGSAFQNLS
jgi:hypothetical protein